MEYLKRKKFQDTDGDTLDDAWERDVGWHDENNKPLHPIKHINVGGTLSSVNGILAISHDHLDSTIHHIGEKEERRFCLTIPEPRKLSMSLKMKNPKMSGFDVKRVKIPSAELDDTRMKVNESTFDEDKINKRIHRILKKKKVRKK